jgi:hypothetical protein
LIPADASFTRKIMADDLGGNGAPPTPISQQALDQESHPERDVPQSGQPPLSRTTTATTANAPEVVLWVALVLEGGDAK